MPYLVKLRDDDVASGVLIAGRPERLTVPLKFTLEQGMTHE